MSAANIASGSTFKHQNTITCISKVFKSLEDERHQSLIVVGTENNELMIIDKSCLSVALTVQLDSVPVCIEACGSFDVDYKIFVACKNGFTYIARKG